MNPKKGTTMEPTGTFREHGFSSLEGLWTLRVRLGSSEVRGFGGFYREFV